MSIHRRVTTALVAVVAVVSLLVAGAHPANAVDPVPVSGDGASLGFGAPTNRITVQFQAWRFGDQILDAGSANVQASYADLLNRYDYSCIFGIATKIKLTSLFPTRARFSCLVLGLKTLFQTGFPVGFIIGEQTFELTESDNIFLPEGIITASVPTAGTQFLANQRHVVIRTNPSDNTGP